MINKQLKITMQLMTYIIWYLWLTVLLKMNTDSALFSTGVFLPVWVVTIIMRTLSTYKTEKTFLSNIGDMSFDWIFFRELVTTIFVGGAQIGRASCRERV